MLANYLKIAWRNLRQQKLYSLINIGSLSVAISAALLIMMWVQNELRFDRDVPNAERIYLIRNEQRSNNDESWITLSSPYPLGKTIAQRFPEVEEMSQLTRSSGGMISLYVDDQAFTEDYVAYVGKQWFELLHYKFEFGSSTDFYQHPYSVILTESKAKKMFGRVDVMDRTIRMDSTDFIVRGVIKDNPLHSSFQFDILFPIASQLNSEERLKEADNWRYNTHYTIVQLHPDTNPKATAGKIDQLYAANRPKESWMGTMSATMLPLLDLHFTNNIARSVFPHGERSTVEIFAVLAFLLLAAACVNYVNLAIARTGMRSKEIGMRKIAGASRRQLFFQIIAECVLVSLLALGVAMVIVLTSLPSFNAFTEQNFLFNPLEPYTGALLLGCWLVMLLLISIYPALLISSINPLNMFQGIGFLQIKPSSFRQILTVGQFSMAVVMIVGTVIVYWQFTFMQQQHKGYTSSQLLTVQVPRERITISSFEESVAYGEKLKSRVQSLKKELQSQSSIRHVVRLNTETIINNGHFTSGGVDWDGRAPDFHPEYVDFGADEDLNKIMKFEFVEGRWFDPQISSDKENTVLNETAVKRFGLTPPVVGKRFDDGVVIGVVKDFYHQNMHEKIAPVVLRANAPNCSSFLIETQPGQVTNALGVILSSFEERFLGTPFKYAFMDQEFDQLYRQDKKALQFTLVFSGLSILISCVGLLGMVTLSTEQRTKEIGIRKVLGASVASIVALLSQDFMKLVLIAIVIASPIAWYAMRTWLSDFAYKIDIEWWYFALAGGLAVGIALLTVSFQSIKAALMNPVKSLRSE
ncbi:ABC transporter permease [Salmonirosea aquatica]|uniref:FtsX-like permease family protein n=1 Tax=Salmonirosea aquatica TaxID=2654236 RepID=A0A7C9BKD2_9BACT|nr:FtsX-like permease family protein [Cytophagaceae bacterium SJW1-29]